MPKHQKIAKNPSFTETGGQSQVVQTEKPQPVKKNAVKPLEHTLSLNSNNSDTAVSTSSKKSSQTDTNSRGSLSHAPRKGSRNSSIRVSTTATIVPIDSEGELIIAKTRNLLDNEVQSARPSSSARPTSSARPSSSSSTQSADGKASGRSILKKSRYAANSERLPPIHPRRDSSGVAIKKGGKGHKILFRGNHEDVKIVENWKIYNGHEYNTQSCNCNIF